MAGEDMQNDLIITACSSLGCLLLVTATARVCILVSWNIRQYRAYERSGQTIMDNSCVMVSGVIAVPSPFLLTRKYT